MRAVARLLLLSSLASLPSALSSCSLFRPDPGAGGDEGEGEGEGEGEAPTIVAIDGDGSATAVGAPLREGDVGAAHRVGRSLIVTGSGFVGVDVQLRADDDDDDDDDVIVRPAFTVESPVRLSVDLSTLPRAGLFTLVVASAAGSATAQVFVLQGEPGRTSLTSTVPASERDCRFGGLAISSGVDVDGNGTLDDGEGGVALVVCDQTITRPVALDIADGVELLEVIEDLRAVRIAPTGAVVLQLRSGVVQLPEGLTIDHPDGALVTILGGDSRTTLTVGDVGAKIAVNILNGGLNLGAIDLGEAGQAQGATGLSVADHARVTFETLTIRGFDAAVVVGTNGVLRGTALDIADAQLGLLASDGGVVQVQTATVAGSGVTTGMSATSSASITIGRYTFTASATVDDPGDVGISAIDLGRVVVGAGAIVGGRQHVFAASGARVSLTGMGLAGATSSIAALEGAGVVGADMTSIQGGDPALIADRGGTISLITPGGGTALAPRALARANGVVTLANDSTCTAETGGRCNEG